MKETTQHTPKKNSSALRLWLLLGGLLLALGGVALLVYLMLGQDGGQVFAGLKDSPWATLIAGLLLAGGIAGLILSGRRSKEEASPRRGWDTRTLVTGALCVGLSFVLSCIKLYEMPNGGAITPGSMLPILIFAYMYGTPKSLLICLAYGLLQMLQGVYFLNVLQFLLDYILAFMALSLAGLPKKNLFLAILVGCLGRYVIACLAGLYWIPEGANPIPFTLLYNLTYIGPESALCLLVAAIPGLRKNIALLKNKALA